MEKLVGKTVEAVEMNAAKDCLRIHCAGGVKLYASATGGCCSTSWFEHINGLDALLGSEVLACVDRPMPEPAEAEMDSCDVTRRYGWTLETTKGRCDFEMRNHSNGYYGGECVVDVIPRDQYNYERDSDDVGALSPLTEDF